MGHQESRRRPSSGPRIPGYLGRVLNERDRPTGTCFQVAPGVLVTAAHVLNDVGIGSAHASVAVDSLEDGGTFRATVAHLDHVHDIAILTSEERLPAVADYLAYTDTAPPWMRVSVTGHAVIDDGDHRYRYLVATGEWAGPTERDGIPLGSMTAARTMRGMSGAPVVRDGDRTVIGLVSGRYNAADSWLLGNVWVARTENLVPLLLQLPGVRVDQVPTASQDDITVLRVTNGSGQGNDLPSVWPQHARSSPAGAPEREKTQAETLEELQLSVVSIFHKVRGTEAYGFFIAPRTMLTVKHILTDSVIGARYKASQNGREFEAFVVDVPEELDLAILEADEPSNFWLPLDRSPAIGDRLLAFGPPGGKRGRHSFTAEVEGVVNDKGGRLLTFRSRQIAESFVGAPLYNLDRRGVSGVIKSTRDSRTSNGGRAVAIASVLEALPGVREIVRDLSPPAHPRDRTSLSTAEKMELLAKEVLAGDAVAVIGDVLDSSDHLSRRAVDEFIRRDLLHTLDNNSKRFELLKYLRSPSGTPGNVYETLACLPFSTVLSLHPDAKLERALHSCRAVTLDANLRVSDLGVGTRDLYLFGGSVLFGEGLILNQDDRDDLRERYTRLYRGFRDRLAMAPILFIGCSLAHWATKRLISDIVSHRTSRDGQLFADASSSDWSAVALGDTSVIDLAPAELLTVLSETVAGRRPIQIRTWVDQIPKRKGFRYLDHYTESDRSVFFARSRDCEELLGVVLSAPSKISVLCGRSGAGKTSLVLAGLQPLLHRKIGIRVEYIRSTADPLRMLENCIANVAGIEPGYSLATDYSFVKLREHSLEISDSILFVVDQIEEAFVKGGKRATTDFLAKIRDLARSDWFPARFLLVVREDFLHELANDQEGGASTLASVYRLSDFDHSAASIVVRETAAAMGWECEHGFVGTMLEDLSPDYILPSHLQIVCHRVQEQSTEIRKFSVSAYTRLGRASTILRDHVDNMLDGLPGEKIRQIKSILAAMVTSRDTKSLLTDDEIALRSGLPSNVVKITLLELIHDFRLVREVQVDDIRFELAHESLVPTVIEWLKSSDHRLRTVQDIVDQEVVLGRRDPAHIISGDRLSLIESVLNELNLSEDALSLAASSFCVRGSIPTAVAGRLAALSKSRQIDALWVRPVASDSHQFEAVLRSPVCDALPEYEFHDLPESLRSRITDALRNGDDYIFRRLLKILGVAPGLEDAILERLVSGGETALHTLFDSASEGSLALLAHYDSHSADPTVSSLRLGLRLNLEYIDRWVESANIATELMDDFFHRAQRAMRRADTLRVTSEFLADGHRPLNPAIFGKALCALARRGSRLQAADGLLTRRSARFVQDAVAKVEPDQAIAICGSLINYALLRDSDSLQWLTGLGSLIIFSFGKLSADCNILRNWIDGEPDGTKSVARALGWSMKLPDYVEASDSTVRGLRLGIEAFRSNSGLSGVLATLFPLNSTPIPSDLELGLSVLSDEVLSLLHLPEAELDLWDLPEPTEADLEKLEELEAVISEREATLFEQSRWRDSELSEWVRSELADHEDTLSDEAW